MIFVLLCPSSRFLICCSFEPCWFQKPESSSEQKRNFQRGHSLVWNHGEFLPGRSGLRIGLRQLGVLQLGVLGCCRSRLWLRFNPWPGNVMCCGCCYKMKKKIWNHGSSVLEPPVPPSPTGSFLCKVSSRLLPLFPSSLRVGEGHVAEDVGRRRNNSS